MEANMSAVVVTITPPLDTGGPHSDLDVLFNPIRLPAKNTGSAISKFAEVPNGAVDLISVVVIDQDDQGQPFDLLFMNAANSLGTPNQPANISDANALAIVGKVQVLSGDYSDIGGARIARPPVAAVEQLIQAGRDLYVAAISRGTGTYTAAGLKITLGAEQLADRLTQA
jgi:hypothetical protein